MGRRGGNGAVVREHREAARPLTFNATDRFPAFATIEATGASRP